VCPSKYQFFTEIFIDKSSVFLEVNASPAGCKEGCMGMLLLPAWGVRPWQSKPGCFFAVGAG